MKTSNFTFPQIRITYLNFIFYLIILLIPNSAFSQSFQRNFGNTLDDSFSKVIKDGSNYYVLGQHEPSSGALSRATVTRLDANGSHQWTLTLDIASVWNDAVLTPNGDLMVVGGTLPFDDSSASIMGLVTDSGGGNFTWIRLYDQPGRDFFFRIVLNAQPEMAAFPYYVLGSQNQPNATALTDDVVLFNLDAAGNFNWKKIYPNFGDAEFFRDFEALPSGELLLAGNGISGLIFKTDNAGVALNGAEISNISFKDIGLESSGGLYAAANGITNNDAHILKFDQDLLLIWDVIVPQLNSVNQVWEGMPGEIYATGNGNFGAQNRDVIIKLLDNGPTIAWVKYLDAGSGFTGGSSWLMPNNEIAFTDARVISGGFGGSCAFISVSDLDLVDACKVSEDMATLAFADALPDGPILPEINFEDFPIGIELLFSALDWREDEVCNSTPCAIAIAANFVDSCGHIQVTSTSTGPLPYSYQWCSGESTPNLDVILPCGTHTFCVTLTCGDGSTATATQTITVVDNTPPTALCVAPFGGVDLFGNCDFNVSVGLIDAGSFDDCQIQSMSVSPTILSGCGVFPITLTVVDWCGNISTCTTSIQWLETEPPLLTCPVNLVLNCDNNLDPSLTGFPAVIDNCDPNPFITYTDVISGLMPCDGLVTRTWTAKDRCDNESSCTQNINVIDNIPPVIICPQNVIVDLAFLLPCETVVNGIQWLSLSDNCSTPFVTYNITGTTSLFGNGDASGQTFNQGVSTVTYTAMDDCGNSATCSFLVNVDCMPDSNTEKCGWTVTTCYSFDPNDPVGVIYDTRYNSSALSGTDWGISLNPGAIHPPDWKASIIGNVFGIALDNVDKIFLAASDVYKYDANYLNTFTGQGGSAGVYRTDCKPPYITTNIVSTVNLPKLPSIAGTMLPNTAGIGNGIGNICYDRDHNQLFLSNLEDGRIYRIDPNGNILSAYDPLALDNGLPGMAPVSERIWGVGYSKNRVYFTLEGINASQKYVYSVGVNIIGGEFAATNSGGNLYTDLTPNPELTINIPGIQLKFTDIAFTQAGDKMLLSERGNPHSASDFEFKLIGTTWTASTNNFYVGATNNGANSAGGVDYGYREQGGNPTAICDGLVWATGNYMMTGSPVNLVYGLEGILASGNSFPGNSNSDIYIDFDGIYVSSAKNRIGDVEVFKCGCPGQATFCDSISVTTMPFNGMQDTCCFQLNFDIQKPNFFTAIQLCAGTGVSFSNVSVLNGCGLQSYSAGQITVVPAGGVPNTFPVGSKDFINFCLSNYQTVTTQQVIVKYYGLDYEIVCTDTLTFNCTQKAKCLKVTADVECGPNGTYDMDFCVMANALIAFDVGSFQINPPSGVILTPSIFTPNPTPLTAGNMQCNFMTNISGNVVDGQTICFSITAHKENIVDGEALLNCCTDTVMMFCVTMPSCVCDKVFAETMPVNSQGDTCCWNVNLSNNYLNNYFSGVQLEICTPGVVFGAINNPGFIWNLSSNDTLATFKPIPGPFIGASATLPTFCLSGIDSILQVPQIVLLKWLGPNGQIVCTDTLKFDCPPPVISGCAELVCPQIECDPDISSLYNLTFQVQNNSGFTVNQINLNGITGCGVITNTQFATIPVLNGNISGFLSTAIMGCSPGQQICLNLTVHEVNSNGNELNCCTNSQQYCFTIPTCGFCEGNLVQNGDFENGVPSGRDESIHLANDWMRIWPLGFGLSSADFWNTDILNPTAGVSLPTPTPIAQSQFAGFWCHNTTELIWREGIMNDLFGPPILPFTGNYELSMKVACLDNSLPGASFSVYGVPSLATTAINITNPLTGTSPLNPDLFSPAAILLVATYPIPVECNATFTDISFQFNSNILPAQGIDRIYLTRTDGVSGKAYLAVDEVCLKAIDECCRCGTFSDMSYRPFQGAPNQSAMCGETLVAQCDGTIPWTLSGNFSCNGVDCPDSTQMSWTLIKPDSTISNGSMISDPGFSVSLAASEFSMTGLYQLTLTAICGTDTCYCEFVIEVQCDTDPCCSDFDAFCALVAQGFTVVTDPALCKITVTAPQFDACHMFSTPPHLSGAVVPQVITATDGMWMFNINQSGVYTICVNVFEETSDSICWQKEMCTTIDLLCESCCTNFDDFCERIDNAVTITVDNNLCKAKLTLDSLNCNDYLEYVDWGDSNTSPGPIPPGGMAMHTYQASGTYIISYLAIEIGDDGYICFEKIVNDTITVVCDDCPCEIEDIQALGVAVDKGFATISSSLNCQVCFAPIALSECETVEWFINNLNTIPAGSSTGNQTFCHNFVTSGTYNVIMVVTRLRPDGTICEVFTKSKTVNVSCSPHTSCEISALPNPGFSEGAIPGGLNSGGMGRSDGWTAAAGEPMVIEGASGSMDGWTIDLVSDSITTDVLTTIEPICPDFDRDTTISLRFGIKEKGIKSSIAIAFYRGDDFEVPSSSNWNPIRCLVPVSIDLEPLQENVWYDLEIDVSLSEWISLDTCSIRPAIYWGNQTSEFSTARRTAAQIDEFCLGTTTVAVKDLENYQSINLFPNPTSGDLTIQFVNGFSKDNELQIFDLLGRIVHSELLTNGQFEHSFSLESQPSGIYFIKVSQNGNTFWTEKIVKQ